MVTRSHTFVPGEWYHCYSRGVEKNIVFKSKADYQRFLGLLYVTNAEATIHRSDFVKKTLDEIFAVPRKKTRVAIGAYCLMPNHIHLLLKEKRGGGISSFMLKLMTGYGMYFNIRHEHEGSVFTRPFRSRHVFDDRYFQHVVDYIHVNPAEIFEPRWKEGRVQNMDILQSKLIEYPYSSFGTFYNTTKPESVLLDQEIFDVYEPKSLKTTLQNALSMYQSNV